jgi:hypothetical protein
MVLLFAGAADGDGLATKTALSPQHFLKTVLVFAFLSLPGLLLLLLHLHLLVMLLL